MVGLSKNRRSNLARGLLITLGIMVLLIASAWWPSDVWLLSIPGLQKWIQDWTIAWGDTFQSAAALLEIAKEFVRLVIALASLILFWLGLRSQGQSVPRSFLPVVTNNGERMAQWRARMRKKVESQWIEGLLRKSFVPEIPIHMSTIVNVRGESSRKEIFLSSQISIEEQKRRKDSSLPIAARKIVDRLFTSANPKTTTEVSIRDVFAQSENSMLILGKAGVGKTTVLLTLMAEMLARQDATSPEPIPVYFHLSSWISEKLPLVKWLESVLVREYKLPLRLAKQWVEEDALALFLDGLDEVRGDELDKCVECINDYLLEHGLVDVCICCRSDVITRLKNSPALIGRISLQPLTPQQIDQALKRMGISFDGLRTVIAEDEGLQEFVDTPLILDIACRTYENMSASAIAHALKENASHRTLFDNYVNRMLSPNITKSQIIDKDNYTQEGTIHFLSWMAYQMRQENLSSFLIENLRMEWFHGSKWLIKFAIGLTIGFGISLIAGLFVGLWLSWGDTGFWSTWGPAPVFTFILSFTLSFGVIIAQDISFTSRRFVLSSIILTIAFAILNESGLFRWLGLDLNLTIQDTWNPGIALGIVLGLSLSFLVSLPWFDIFGPISNINLDSLTILYLRLRPIELIIFNLIAYIFYVLAFGITDVLYEERPLLEYPALWYLLRLPVIVFWFYGNLSELTGQHKLSVTSNPNERVFQGIKNAAIMSLVAGTVSWFCIYVALRISQIEPLVSIYIGLFMSLMIGLYFGLYFGLASFVKHIVLRLFLFQAGAIPWDYTDFLDYGADRIFLHKVGGGYVFAHPLLLDYFAALYEETT